MDAAESPHHSCSKVLDTDEMIENPIEDLRTSIFPKGLLSQKQLSPENHYKPEAQTIVEPMNSSYVLSSGLPSLEKRGTLLQRDVKGDTLAKVNEENKPSQIAEDPNKTPSTGHDIPAPCCSESKCKSDFKSSTTFWENLEKGIPVESNDSKRTVFGIGLSKEQQEALLQYLKQRGLGNLPTYEPDHEALRECWGSPAPEMEDLNISKEAVDQCQSDRTEVLPIKELNCVQQVDLEPAQAQPVAPIDDLETPVPYAGREPNSSVEDQEVEGQHRGPVDNNYSVDLLIKLLGEGIVTNNIVNNVERPVLVPWGDCLNG